ncbi:phosphatase PAP2 family protein [Actinomadura macra]|uniref:phosphatase PAP2 family protein n=1 Tax=Actinomadura macra TaxID=46164 RepID=UPI0008308091|nr:phosphatase PAP2 family protein [Actinomadura macra]
MLTAFMHVMSYLGSAGFYIPLLVAVYWCVDPRLAARATVILSFSSVVNTVLKLMFHAPRPYWTDPGVTGRESKVSFGMPSGHAQNAMAFWGFFATRTRRRLGWVAAVVVIVLIGVSRVYLGVHSTGQVLAGWAIGLVLLVAALGLEPMVVPWWTRRPVAVQMVLALAIALVGVGVAWGAVHSLQGWQWPDAWARAIQRSGGSTRPITLNEVAAACGGLCGILAGVSLLSARGWFDPGGAPWRRLARLPVGVLGAVILYGLAHYGGSHPVQAFAVQTLAALWATVGAPEVFVRLGLARRPTRPITLPGDETAELRQ